MGIRRSQGGRTMGRQDLQIVLNMELFTTRLDLRKYFEMNLI
jgi:hypothetical protein